MTLDETKAKVLKSIAISYFYVIVLKAIFEKINLLPFITLTNDISGIWFNFFLIFLSIIFPYAIYRIEKKENLLNRIKRKLEISRTRFFCLSKYRKYIFKENGKKKKLADYSDDEKEKVLIYFDMISHFEIANVDKVE